MTPPNKCRSYPRCLLAIFPAATAANMASFDNFDALPWKKCLVSWLASLHVQLISKYIKIDPLPINQTLTFGKKGWLRTQRRNSCGSSCRKHLDKRKCHSPSPSHQHMFLDSRKHCCSQNLGAPTRPLTKKCCKLQLYIIHLCTTTCEKKNCCTLSQIRSGTGW